MSADHYLRTELYQLVASDHRILDFMQAGSLDGIWYWDLENPDHEWMSPRFWETFGYDPSAREHLAAEWQNMIHPDDLQTALENFHAHCEDPDHPYDQYVRYRHKAGHWSWVRCRGLAIRDDQGKPIRMLGVHVDVTELKQAEERQRHLLEQARVANEDLNLFAYAASHDLQSPIKSLAGLVNVMRLEIDSDGAASTETVDRIERTVGRMQSLVDSVLFLSRDNNRELTCAPVELEPMIADLLSELSLPDDASIRLENLAAVMADGALLLRALRNMLSNSLQHRATGRPLVLVVRQSQRNGYDDIVVEDNGVGIPAGEEESLFRMFARDHGEGHGLGLAVLRRIAQAHRGSASMTSLPVGARCTLSLPRQARVS